MSPLFLSHHPPSQYDRCLRIVRGRPLVPPDDRAVPRDDAGEDLRAAEVDPDRVTAVHPQWVP